VTGRAWSEAGVTAHGGNRAGDMRVDGVGEGIGGRSCELLMAGPHVAASEREGKMGCCHVGGGSAVKRVKWIVGRMGQRVRPG
jgi:hypothetical protein